MFQPSYRAYAGYGAGAYSLPAGVQIDSGVLLNDTMVAFLHELRAEIPTSVIPVITVTSGIRTAEAQASAMWKKFQSAQSGGKDGWRELLDIYSDSLIEELKRVGASQSSWVSVIKAQMARGAYLSDHMRADALDFSGSRHTATQRAALLAAAKKLGVKAIEEKYPVHVHMEDLSKMAKLVRKGATTYVNWWLWSVAVGGALLIGVATYTSLKRK